MRSLHNIIKGVDQYSVPERQQGAAPPPAALSQTESALTEANAIRKNAYATAKSIVDAANTYSKRRIEESLSRIHGEGAQLRKRGYEEGFAAGLEAGRQEGHRAGYADGLRLAEQQNQELYSSYLSIIDSLEKSRQKILDQQREELTDLALLIARRVIAREIDGTCDALPGLVASVLEQYRNVEWARVFVSERIMETLRTDPETLRRYEGASGEVKWMGVHTFSDMDCVIELATEVVDISVDSQLEKIRSVIKY